VPLFTSVGLGLGLISSGLDFGLVVLLYLKNLVLFTSLDVHCITCICVTYSCFSEENPFEVILILCF